MDINNKAKHFNKHRVVTPNMLEDLKNCCVFTQ